MTLSLNLWMAFAALDDNKLGMSMEDRKFIDIMNHSLTRSELGNWEAPLPLREETKVLPDNRKDALRRLKSTRRTLDKKPLMRKHYFDFMQKLVENDHAEPVPDEEPPQSNHRWYLPHFGVYHPQKPDKIRVVFDSASETNGVSLNKMLLSGPDLTNSLLGVLIRFRQNPVAFMADIEQMFHSFLVRKEHRDLLRFLWYKDNDPDGELIEYRMKVHVFGNTSSPAVATFCLRKTAELGEEEFGSDAKEFVHNNFYVDDGLKSVTDSAEAVDLLSRTQAMLAAYNLRLHKIVSNDPNVTQAFPKEDRASDLLILTFHRTLSRCNAPWGCSGMFRMMHSPSEFLQGRNHLPDGVYCLSSTACTILWDSLLRLSLKANFSFDPW